MFVVKIDTLLGKPQISSVIQKRPIEKWVFEKFSLKTGTIHTGRVSY